MPWDSFFIFFFPQNSLLHVVILLRSIVHLISSIFQRRNAAFLGCSWWAKPPLVRLCIDAQHQLQGAVGATSWSQLDIAISTSMMRYRDTSLKLTANAPENRRFKLPPKKETRKSSNHPFSGANLLLVSGRVNLIWWFWCCKSTHDEVGILKGCWWLDICDLGG